MAPAIATYEPRDPSRTVLYKVIADHLETFLASFEADPDATGLPAYVQRELYDYLQCGILAHGFLRQAAGVLPVVCGTAHGADGGPPGRAGDSLGADTAMGRLGPHPLAVLDGRVPGPDRDGPYDH